jgi:hypothetical protein
VALTIYPLIARQIVEDLRHGLSAKRQSTSNALVGWENAVMNGLKGYG